MMESQADTSALQKVNNTLWNNQCPRANHDLSDEILAKWDSVFAPPIVRRLNALAPGANLTQGDIMPLMSLCSFETLARQKTSLWCWVFKPKEYEKFEYWTDLEKYYFTGYVEPYMLETGR
jgi:Histidine phosphatase superfamily (branch 2)